MLRAEADRAQHRAAVLEGEARAAAAANDARIASLEDRILATSQGLDSSVAEKTWQAGLAAVQRVWRCPSLPF